MPTSDSEDFESADEGNSNADKKERKHRKSSSNYSDNALESESPLKEPSGIYKSKTKQDTDGWDDFEIEENESLDTPMNKPNVDSKDNESPIKVTKEKEIKSQDTGWDDFDDWGEGGASSKEKTPKPQSAKPDPKIQEVTERLAAASTNSGSSWGWGWGVDSLLSTATAGITSITNQVSQGITTVLETGIGAPDPEELARQAAKESGVKEKDSRLEHAESANETEDKGSSGDGTFPFGSILKFVGNTGTKVISGGLDTLETIGRKTMEVLQDGDPGLARKRAMLGLDPNKPVLSQVLREAKAKAEEEDRVREEKREAKEVHYENLFDDFEGLVHLEALEMLSKQVSMRIEERLRNAKPDEKQDMKETLQQVSELCDMPEEDDDDLLNDEPAKEQSKSDAFLEKLQKATEDLGVKLQFQPLVKQYTEILEWFLSTEADHSEKTLYKRAISSLAQATALSVEMYHKAAEMLLVKPRRSTADEADAMTQMTVVLTKHTSELATLYTQKLHAVSTFETSVQVKTYITNIFLEAGNSSTYIQTALLLTLPIIQIGAV